MEDALLNLKVVREQLKNLEYNINIKIEEIKERVDNGIQFLESKKEKEKEKTERW